MIRILTTLFLIIGISSCNMMADNPPKTKSKKMEEKVLVVFFSHAGDNYSVGNVKEGNTKLVVDVICEQTGADRFEIVAQKSYDMAYTPLTQLAKEEQQKGELPAYLGSVDVSQYSTIFIGGPVWWGTYPQVMFTFFKDHDLNGKTIIPFTTHEGSGLGSCVRDLKKAYPKATFKEAFSIYGHEVRTESGKREINSWLIKLGWNK